jgi:hypothetical protein
MAAMASKSGWVRVNFDVTPSERALITQIVNRIVETPAFQVFGFSRVQWDMDICATHRNGCPLRLADLLNADAFNFNHDIAGIARHINRKDGTLGGCFVPRFAVSQ